MRIYPIVLIACLILLGVKAYDLYSQTDSAMEAFTAASVMAEEKEASHEEDAGHGAKSEEEMIADAAEEQEEGDEEDTVEMGTIANSPPAEDYTTIELELLQRLAVRREQLDEREHQIELKENVLQLTEEKVNEKLAQLRELKVRVETLLEQYNEREERKINSLVKIYESMKPKDAAEIFADLEADTLLRVIDRMKEKKVAPILAQMPPKRAKEMTVLYAKQRQLQ